MRRRPLTLFLCALLFLYFPAEFVWRLTQGFHFNWAALLLSVVAPVVLILGLIRVTRSGWYTLVGLCALWGMDDLYVYYARNSGGSMAPLFVHILIYLVSLGYFINPRVRTLYFDPKLRWWRAKPRYETFLPFLLHDKKAWCYPILRNVSEGGCFVETNDLLKVNDTLEVSIPLPVPLNVSVIKAEGEVRWVSNNPLRKGMGVQFHKLVPETVKALRLFVAREL